MSLYDTLAQNTKQAKESKTKKAQQEAQEIFKKIEKTLIEKSNDGVSKAEFNLVSISKEARKELQKLLKEQGLVVELFDDRDMIVSWPEKDFRKPLKGEVFRWYELENSVDRWTNKVSYSGTTFEDVKEEMVNYCNYYGEPGTGRIMVNIITINDGQQEKQSFEVYKNL